MGRIIGARMTSRLPQEPCEGGITIYGHRDNVAIARINVGVFQGIAGTYIDWGDGNAPEEVKSTDTYKRKVYYPRSGKTIKIRWYGPINRMVSSGSLYMLNQTHETSYPLIIDKLIVNTSDTLEVNKYLFDSSCTSLKTLILGENVGAVAARAFRNNTNLETVEFRDPGCLLKYDTGLENGTFWSCTNLKHVVYPNDEYNGIIPDGCFRACDSLSEFAIPDSITSIKQGAFQFTALKSVRLPEYCSSVEYLAFSCCDELTEFDAGSSRLGTFNFECVEGSDALACIRLPAALTQIANYGYGSTFGTTIERHMYVYKDIASAAVAPTCPGNGGSMGEYMTHASSRIHVPASSLSFYKAATGWSDFASKIVAI